MSFPIRAIVKLRRILLRGLVIAGAFYAVMLMPKMLRLLRKSNQEDIGKEIQFNFNSILFVSNTILSQS